MALAAIPAIAFIAYGAVTAVRMAAVYNEMVEGRDLLVSAEGALREEGLNPSPAGLADAESRLAESRGKFRSARDAMAGQPLLRLAGWLPALGAQISAARALADIGYQGSEIGLAGVAALRTFDEMKDDDRAPGEKAMAYLDASRPMMTEVEERLATIRETRDAIDTSWLLPPLRGFVRRADAEIAPVEESVETYRNAREAAGRVLGFDGARSHLVLGMDNTELLPGGGLIGMYGVVTFEGGRMVESSFGEAGELTGRWQARSGGEYVEPPLPLKRYLLRDWTWNFAVSGWSPDFPASARQALFFYQRSGAEPLDDAIAIDFSGLQGLLAVLGPTEIDGYGVTVDSENATEEILARIGRPLRPEDGAHDFAAVVAAEVLEGVQAAGEDKWVPLLEALNQLAAGRHLLLYSNDPPTQHALESLGWAGEVRDETGDYLMAVDASVHSSKLNLVLEEEMSVDVRIGEDGSAEDTVTLRYDNRLSEWAQGRPPELVTQMLTGFYGGYLRLLAPPRAELEDVRLGGRAAGAEEVTEEAGKTSFGRYFALPGDSDAAVTFSYAVPAVVDESGGIREYRLLIQKQPGARAMPLVVTVGLPEGARVESVSLDGKRLPDGPLRIQAVLSEDRELVVRYDP
jgi:hypothetical protein